MQEFLESLTALGYAIPNLNLDGKIHRFNRDGKSNGWYVGWQNHYIKGDGTYIVAVFGDWKTGEHHTYKPTKRMTREDSAVIKEQLERARRASEEERVTKQNDAAIEAEKVWRNISTSNQGVSDYATRKMISSMRGVAVDGEGTIFIPMRDINGKLWGCQRIFQDGSKRFLFGQKVVGTFHSIGAISDETTDVYICEGWATGDAIHAATQATVIVSFNAGNLKTVARDIHLNYPMARITICADNDRFTKTGNIGIDKANEAATVCHGVVKIPQFTNPEKGTDFNALLVQEGAESVRDQLTEKEELYCRKYVELLNQRQAYMASRDTERMKPNTVDRRASELHQKPHIQARINELMAEREQRLQIDADYVLRRLVEIDQMDVLDILKEDGALKPISEWPKCWRTTLSGLDINTTITNYDETTTENILKKIKWPDKVRNLELIGKHVRVGAFKEQLDHTSSDGSMTPKGTINIGELSDSAMAEILKARDAADS